ncbi:hypothetical protein PT974_10853 [Cladobotryum mycophilum]|uniref:Small EDRK-rich factor-like N-terminal domain-containing protein n=1 Tax=Cladobotryum mycophilum TaxID=491253 RepID=A0ABR0SB69_9HYPO
MARGNQRDLARAKNQKEQAGKKLANNQTGTQLKASRENAADIMRRKQAEADAKKAAENSAGGGTKKK